MPLPSGSYRYPPDSLHDGERLTEMLGTHWSAVYDGRELIYSLQAGVGMLEEQNRQDWLEARDCASRQRTPIWHVEHWRRVLVRQSSLGTRVIRYGDPVHYGDGYVYGGSLHSRKYLLPLPAGFVQVPVITSGILSPARLLVHGLDYSLDLENGYLELLDDPFLAGGFTVRPVFEDGEIVDQELELWLHMSREDRRYLDQHWGYVLAVQQESSVYLRSLLNVIYDALISGSALQHVQDLVAATTGVASAVGTEVVERIVTDSDHLWVITDQQAYSYSKTATASVAVGQVVMAGQPLADSVLWFDFNRGLPPAELSSLMLGKEQLADGFLEGLAFPNATVPLVAQRISGSTKVSFELGGFSADVDRFWDEVHARGLAAQSTLAQRMRPDLPDPLPADLPLTVNPLQFLLENMLRFNTLAVKIRVRDSRGGAGLQWLRQMRKILPPWTACLLLLELEPPAEEVSMDGPGDAATSGYADGLDSFTAGTPFEETIAPGSFVSETVQVYHIQEDCR